MKRCRNGVIWLLAVLIIWCFSSAVVAAYDATSVVMSKLQGKWYDADGTVVLNVQGNAVNDCAVVGVYNLAGGSSDFDCVIRIVEATGYRDLPVACENLRKDSYHAHVILKRNPGKDTLLMRTTDAQYYETVGGIGLDMPEKDVLAKYGNPDKIQKSKIWKSFDVWQYRKLGLELTMRHQRVWIIQMYRNGNRHFDRTGLNCSNSPSEFQSAYGFQQLPKSGNYGAYSVGHGEYMWFNDYPTSITFSLFSH